MKLNLGCGPDIRSGYVNVDLRHGPGVLQHDLSKFPWPWRDNSVDEILMLDFLEHFPYRQTKTVLSEVSRILKAGGFVDIQVPDFYHCALALMNEGRFNCNKCGYEFRTAMPGDGAKCNCGATRWEIAESAMQRLYGGQDYPGNWHYTTFTYATLTHLLSQHELSNFERLDVNHQTLNWNIKVRAYKNVSADKAW